MAVVQSSAATNNNAVWCLAANQDETCIAVSRAVLFKLMFNVDIV